MSDIDPVAPDGVGPSFVPALTEGVTVVPVEQEAVAHDAATGILHLLDPIATIVVQLFDGNASIAELAADLAAAFEAPLERVTEDVVALVAELGGTGLVAGVAATVVASDGRDRIERALVDGC